MRTTAEPLTVMELTVMPEKTCPPIRSEKENWDGLIDAGLRVSEKLRVIWEPALLRLARDCVSAISTGAMESLWVP